MQLRACFLRWVAPATLLASALATIPPAAADDASFSLSASAIQGQGRHTADGFLVALLLEHQGGELAPAGFDLQAEQVRVETDHANPVVHPGLDLPWLTLLQPETDHEEHRSAAIRGTENRAGYRFNLYPMADRIPPQVEISSSCSGFQAPMGGEIVREARVQDPESRPAFRIDPAQALDWTNCQGSTSVTLTGDFIVGAWEWDMELTADGTTESLWSGSRESSTGPQGAYMREDRETYLYATDGRATFLFNANAPSVLLLQDGVRSQGIAFLLQDAHGSLSVGGIVAGLSGEEASFEGALQAEIHSTGAGQPITAALKGDLRSVEVAGTTVFIAPEPRNLTFSTVLLLGAGLGAILLAMAACIVYRLPASYGRETWSAGNTGDLPEPVKGREWRAFGYWALTRRNLNRAKKTGGARRTRLLWWSLLFSNAAVRLNPDVNDYRWARSSVRSALGLRNMRHWLMELEDHAWLDGRLEGAMQALNAVEAAATCAALGDAPGTRKWLDLARSAHSLTAAGEFRGRSEFLRYCRDHAWMRHYLAWAEATVAFPSNDPAVG